MQNSELQLRSTCRRQRDRPEVLEETDDTSRSHTLFFRSLSRRLYYGYSTPQHYNTVQGLLTGLTHKGRKGGREGEGRERD